MVAASAEAWWPWRANRSAAQPKGSPQATLPGGRRWRACVRAGVRRRPLHAAEFHRAAALEQRPAEGATIVGADAGDHPLLCENVIVRGVTVRSFGPNNDGCDPESCRDVLIETGAFETGDYCIAIKSGRNDDGRLAALLGRHRDPPLHDEEWPLRRDDR